MATTGQVQPEKGQLLKELHHTGKLLLLPNIWDPLGALLLEDIGYAAVATASASVALSNGYADGEKIPFDELLAILQRITRSVNIPVTADIESGYAADNDTLRDNIRKFIEAGIAGINFEDSRQDGKIYSTDVQCERIRVIKETAAQMGMPLFINARADVYLKDDGLSGEEKLSEAIQRGKAYKEAGADGFYPILLKAREDIKIIIDEVRLPVNILLLPGIPDFEMLNKIGVARVSLGPGLLKIAVSSMKSAAEKLLRGEGMDEVIANPISSAYLSDLIK